MKNEAETIKRFSLESVDSTNNFAKEIEPSSLPALVTAKEQTGGRGRFGRSFFSPEGKGIYMSYAFVPEFPVDSSAMITAISAAVIHCVLSEYSNGLAIKWVNDIYKGRLKISGILTEAVFKNPSETPGQPEIDRIVIGIGINVFPGSFPGKLEETAGSLFDACYAKDAQYDCDAPYGLPENSEEREALVERIIGDIAKGLSEALSLSAVGNDGKSISGLSLIDYYRENCLLTGKRVIVRPVAVGDPKNSDSSRGNCEPYEALVTGVSDDFGLIITRDDGTEKVLYGGEVTLH